MLKREEYDELMRYLQPVFKRIWEHENNERKKEGKSLDAFQFGFPINTIWHYKTGENDEEFYIIFNLGFLNTISRQIKIAQTQVPEKFGTGNADDVLEALYAVSNYKSFGDKNEYLGYLVDHCCSYVVYRNKGEFGDVLRIDLLRAIRPNKKNPQKSDIIGGILYALKHFSFDGKNLSTGSDKNDVFDVMHILYLIAIAFRLKEPSESNTNNYKAIQRVRTDYMHASFYKNPITGVFYLNTYFKGKRRQ